MKQPTDETVGLGRRVGGWRDVAEAKPDSQSQRPRNDSRVVENEQREAVVDLPTVYSCNTYCNYAQESICRLLVREEEACPEDISTAE